MTLYDGSNSLTRPHTPSLPPVIGCNHFVVVRFSYDFFDGITPATIRLDSSSILTLLPQNSAERLDEWYMGCIITSRARACALGGYVLFSLFVFCT